ncbi:hypothetical protein Efla_002160 [Eimeria flavescens]
MVDSNGEPSKQPAAGSSQSAAVEGEANSGRKQGQGSSVVYSLSCLLSSLSRPANASIGDLAKLAATKGQEITGHRASVFEGTGKREAGAAAHVDAPGKAPACSAPMHVVGGVRVMPVPNEEMQRILAARLQKNS